MIEHNLLSRLFFGAFPIVMLICLAVFEPRITKGRIDLWNKIVNQYIDNGEAWCLSEIAMTSEKERISHLRSALRRINIKKQKGDDKNQKYGHTKGARCEINR